MIAETMQGNGERAFQYFQQINPAAKNDQIDTYEIEPYVYAQNILGDEHPQFGLGRNSWLSGTASWTYQAATQFILGIRPCFDGLKIDPCIPADWKSFKVTRRFRGATYHIEVENPEGICKGIAGIAVNGEALSTSIIPVAPSGATVKVSVKMGSVRVASGSKPVVA
jgi:cellobiose phosphorylase